MTMSMVFWVLFLVAFIFGGWTANTSTPNPRIVLATDLITFVLLGLLGWRVFGAAIH